MTIGRALSTVAWTGALGAVGAFGLREVRLILSEDPFAMYRPRPNEELPDDVGLRIGESSIRHYRNGELMARARIGRVDITKGRDRFDFAGVTKGWYRSERGPVEFSGDRGAWTDGDRRLMVEGRVTARNRDMDLRTASLEFDAKSQVAVFRKPVSGRVGEGNAVINSLRYALDDGSFTTGGMKYVGRVAMIQDTPEEVGRRKWTIRFDSSRSGGKSKPNTQIGVGAVATDEEVLIRAPLIERNTKTNVLVGSGRVFYYSDRVNLVADKITIYQDEKRAVAEGNVLLLVKPKRGEGQPIPKPKQEPIYDVPNDPGKVQPSKTWGPSPEEKELDKRLRTGKTVREYPSQVAMPSMTYWYRRGERRGLMNGPLRAYQELQGKRWRRLNAASGRYDGEAETLNLESRPSKFDVRMRNSIGDDLTMDRILVSTREGDEEYETGQVSGDVWADPDEEEGKGSGVTKPPAKTGKGRR